MLIKKMTLPALAAIFFAILFTIPTMAFQKQNAAAPGEVLDVQDEETTPLYLSGTFALEVTSTGIGTIQIKRSENKATWIVVKELTNGSATEQRKYLYESLGDDGSRLEGAWYKAVLSTLTSGSYRVRMVK